MRTMSISRYARRTLLVLAAAALAGCTTVVQQGPTAAVVAQLSLERFLQASNARDLEGMGRLFGTSSGPMWNTGSTVGCAFKKIGSWFGGTSCRKRSEVEVQMASLADVLKHEDYRVVREEPVAGRMNDATRIFVDLTVSGQKVSDVPFVLVRSGGGQWLVEEIDLQKVMTGTGRRSAGLAR